MQQDISVKLNVTPYTHALRLHVSTQKASPTPPCARLVHVTDKQRHPTNIVLILASAMSESCNLHVTCDQNQTLIVPYFWSPCSRIIIPHALRSFQ